MRCSTSVAGRKASRSGFFESEILGIPNLNLTLKAADGVAINVIGTFAASELLFPPGEFDIREAESHPVLVPLEVNKNAGSSRGEDRYPVHLHVDWAKINYAVVKSNRNPRIPQKLKIEFWECHPGTGDRRPLFWFYVFQSSYGLDEIIELDGEGPKG